MTIDLPKLTSIDYSGGDDGCLALSGIHGDDNKMVINGYDSYDNMLIMRSMWMNWSGLILLMCLDLPSLNVISFHSYYTDYGNIHKYMGHVILESKFW